MKITIAPSDKPEAGASASAVYYTISVEHPYDDISVDEAVELMKRALVAWGYSETNIDDIIGRS